MSGFSITVNGDAVALSDGVISGNEITFTAASTIYPGDTVLGSYNAATGNIQGETSALPSFTSQPAVNESTQSVGYELNDDGTNAATFNQVHLPTIAPAYTRATYTLTGTTQTLVALPAVIDGVPGLVALTEGVPRVCGFLINSVPGAGDMSPMNFGLYNYGGSGSVLLNVEANKDDGATTGEIKAQAGTYPPSVTQYGSSYFGEMVGTKIAIQATLSSGLLTAKAWVNGTLLGTSTGIATNGGVFALMQIIDGNGSGAVDIQAVPLSTLLADGYGTFDTGAVDMVGTVI